MAAPETNPPASTANLNTYALAVEPSAYGVLVPDVTVIGKSGRRDQLRFRAKGDVLDLLTVDIPTFVRSSRQGLINRMFLHGSLKSVQQAVPLDFASRFQGEVNKLLQFGPFLTGHVGAPEVKMLAPGLQVAVGAPEGSLEAEEVTDPSQMPNPKGPTLEGMLHTGPQEGLGPGLAAGGPVAKPDLEPETLGTGEGAPKPHDEAGTLSNGLAAGNNKTYEGWKYNLTLADQKATITESVDVNFLEWVSTSDDAKQLQKLAQARIEELGQAATSRNPVQ